MRLPLGRTFVVTLAIPKALWVGFHLLEGGGLRAQKALGVSFPPWCVCGFRGLFPFPQKPYGWLITSFSMCFLQVMLAASYWSLLAPAVEMATSSGGFGAFAFFPVAVGFTLGAAFVYLADLLMPHLVSIVLPAPSSRFLSVCLCGSIHT